MLYDGSPAYPDLAGSWSDRREAGATTFGTGAAYVSGCANAGLRLDGEFDLRRCGRVIPTGSPLPPGRLGMAARPASADAVRIDPIAGGTDVCTAFVGGSPLLPVRAR